MTAEEWNARHPLGTPIRFWPGVRDVDGTPVPGRKSRTRSAAWTLGSGDAVVAVEGYPGGIALTHVVPLSEEIQQTIADVLADHLYPGVTRAVIDAAAVAVAEKLGPL